MKITYRKKLEELEVEVTVEETADHLHDMLRVISEVGCMEKEHHSSTDSYEPDYSEEIARG